MGILLRSYVMLSPRILLRRFVHFMLEDRIDRSLSLGSFKKENKERLF